MIFVLGACVNEEYGHVYDKVLDGDLDMNVNVEDMDGNKLFWKDPISGYGEAYVYFDSLYGIYYQWMQKYGFLPSTK